MGLEIGRRDTSRAIGCFGSFKSRLPDPGRVFNDAAASDDRGPQEQPEIVARDNLVELRHRRTSGVIARCQRGFLSAVSPIT